MKSEDYVKNKKKHPVAMVATTAPHVVNCIKHMLFKNEDRLPLVLIVWVQL